MLFSHCWGFLNGQSLPAGLFGSTSLTEGLSCGATVTSSVSNVMAVPIIWTNLEHTKLFIGGNNNSHNENTGSGG